MPKPRTARPAFSLHLCGFIFTPQLIPTLIFIPLLAILLSLGYWQLKRAEYKQNIQQDLTTQAQLPILSAQALTQPPQKLAYRQVKLDGQYLNQYQILLDNRYFNRQPGYQLMTAFRLQKTRQVVLVNRGWIPRQPLTTLHIPNIKGQQNIEGVIKIPSHKTFNLGTPQFKDNTPLLLQWPNLTLIQKQIKQQLLPFIILLSPHSPHGFKRHWHFVVMAPSKHVGYAIQWFALALTLVIIYLVVNTRRKRHGSPRKA